MCDTELHWLHACWVNAPTVVTAARRRRDALLRDCARRCAARACQPVTLERPSARARACVLARQYASMHPCVVPGAARRAMPAGAESSPAVKKTKSAAGSRAQVGGNGSYDRQISCDGQIRTGHPGDGYLHIVKQAVGGSSVGPSPGLQLNGGAVLLCVQEGKAAGMMRSGHSPGQYTPTTFQRAAVGRAGRQCASAPGCVRACGCACGTRAFQKAAPQPPVACALCWLVPPWAPAPPAAAGCACTSAPLPASRRPGCCPASPVRVVAK